MKRETEAGSRRKAILLWCYLFIYFQLKLYNVSQNECKLLVNTAVNLSVHYDDASCVPITMRKRER